MKHAYLIIAHNEYGLLERLVDCLDDERNDIYIHIDHKAAFDGSALHTAHSRLCVLPQRLDARWGDFSLVEVELQLFGEAYAHGPYAYYHLLSGVDLPVKTQDYIHGYCDRHQGTEYVGFAQNASDSELQWRSQHYFLFSREFREAGLVKRSLRAAFARLQSLVGYRRMSCEVRKGSQWCSVTNDFVACLLDRADEVRRCFSHTYCPDEMVMQTLCWNTALRDRVCSLTDEWEGCRRFIKWRDGQLMPLTADDVATMIASDSWFARKFTLQHPDVVDSVISAVGKQNKR